MIFKRLDEQPESYDAYALDRQPFPSVRLPKSWTVDIPDSQFWLCDLTVFEGIRRAVQGMNVVVHLAADPEGRERDSLLNNNIIGTYRVFEACRQEGVRRIVAGSSIMVSQERDQQESYRGMMERRHAEIPKEVTLITPDIPAELRSLYAASKTWTE